MWPAMTSCRLRRQRACYAGEQREQRELRNKQCEEERDKCWWRRCFKSLLRKYGDQKERPGNEDDYRRPNDRIENCSKKSAHVSSPQPQTATSRASRRRTSLHAAAHDVNSEG